ncbi:Olfactory Receptor 2T12 [Manis pentadactyla]|nr:Olfactory Receptor 2T12 [Manis pentadactyla]
MGPYDPQAEIHNFWRTSPPLTFLPHFFPFADDRHTGLTDPEASGITGNQALEEAACGGEETKQKQQGGGGNTGERGGGVQAEPYAWLKVWLGFSDLSLLPELQKPASWNDEQLLFFQTPRFTDHSSLFSYIFSDLEAQKNGIYTLNT